MTYEAAIGAYIASVAECGLLGIKYPTASTRKARPQEAHYIINRRTHEPDLS